VFLFMIILLTNKGWIHAHSYIHIRTSIFCLWDDIKYFQWIYYLEYANVWVSVIYLNNVIFFLKSVFLQMDNLKFFLCFSITDTCWVYVKVIRNYWPFIYSSSNSIKFFSIFRYNILIHFFIPANTSKNVQVIHIL
jgi:hypothetical protein